MDLIDREDALNNIPDDLPYKASVKRVLYQAKAVSERSGEKAVWIKRDNTDKGFAFICSACGGTAYAKPNGRGMKAVVKCDYRFCPNCGSPMEVE